MRAETQQELARELLLELLAYQFAYPVRWIETQDHLFETFKVERLVEIGPSPTLSGMATRTLKAKYEGFDAALSLERQVLSYAANANEIYYIADPPAAAAAPAPSAPAAPTTPTAPAAPAPAAPAASAPAAPTGPVAGVDDAPVSALEILHALIANKLKKSLDQVSTSKAIKDMVGGKSTLQNEILGDLGKEFGSTPEKPEDTPLVELAAQFQNTFDGNLGKQSSSVIARFMSATMPGGFNMTNVNKYLQDRWGLGSGRRNGVFLVAITMAPTSRFSSESDAKAFFDSVVQKYAAIQGINLSSASAAAGSGSTAGAGAAAMIDPAALEEVTKGQTDLVKQQLELFANYLKKDLREGDKKFALSQEANEVIQKQLDLWNAEHGDFYASGINPVFSPLKARTYDSSWNWSRQQVLLMYFDIIFGKLSSVDRDIVSQCISIMNRSSPILIEFMQYHIDHCPEDRSEAYALVKRLGQELLNNCKESLSADPVYKNVAHPTGPRTTIDAKGNITYEEVPRPSVRKLEQYVKEMAAGGPVSKMDNQQAIRDELQRVYAVLKDKLSSVTSIDPKELYAELIGNASAQGMNKFKETIPFLHLKRKSGEAWNYSKDLSSLYLSELEKAAINGITFAGKNVLLTGAGAGSIGAEILIGLISGGAKVVVTTSRFSREVTEYYQSLYARYGAKGSTLIVVPFNQGSKQDVESLVNYIYDSENGLGWDLDAVIPFAAIPENGREIDGIDSKSELAHRIMLTNLLRLLGAIKTQKAEHGYDTRPAQVILPMSPNHGTFGSDGLYSESKLSLETLFNRWYAESWKSYLTICGAVIGWTRGTGLMSQNNIISEGLEKLGARTFSTQEMAFNILGLMCPAIADICQSEPVFADLNGGFQFIENQKEIMFKLRAQIMETSEVRKAVSTDNSLEFRVVNGPAQERLHNKTLVQPRANLKFEFPNLKPYEKLSDLPDLANSLDLDRVVVVTGFSEVSPYGNSRTRWEMEAEGKFSLEGCIEMAWIMGLIKHFNGTLKNGKRYSGWVDAKTNDPVEDLDVKSKYEKYILDHTGIRFIDPDLFDGYDPKRKMFLQEIVVERDLEPFEASKETAFEFKLQNGDKVEIFAVPDSEQYTVRLLKGSVIYVPKAFQFDRLVAGQIPSGWDARKYGIDEDICNQVDRVTLFTLVSVAEALIASGITDPYEFYKYVHVTEVGNCFGSGVGGMTAFKKLFKDRFLEKPVQADILQESFVNTMAAWVNMLLLSSSGPIRTPSGACATAVESLENGYECIVTGKAKICVVGGVDDFQEEASFEFANMKATSNAVEDLAHGRTPAEMSRPATTTRSGFMEAHGSGAQILMSGSLALRMGVPIYGIIGMTSTVSDKASRSVPAPGKGVMTSAREHHFASKFKSPLLDLEYRRRQINERIKQVAHWTESEIVYTESEVAALGDEVSAEEKAAYLKDRMDYIHQEAERQIKDIKFSFGNNFWNKDPSIAPLRGALASWNLSVDDLKVASFHGTSTKANEKNETSTMNQMMEHLGRTKGNAMLSVFQKYLTGHPKGAAAAWMLNGVLQILNTGFVPGNRNADNIDSLFVSHEHLLFPSVGMQTDGIKAATLTSFGFGQKGGQALIIHPDYLYRCISKDEYDDYKIRVAARYKTTYRYFHDGLTSGTLFKAKDKPPYTAEQESSVYLEPLSRVTANKESYSYSTPSAIAEKSRDHNVPVLAKLASEVSSNENIGVDVELVEAINVTNETFLTRNFTDAEISYCQSAPNPQASFAGTWAAKEAVFKSLKVESKGAGAPLKDIEIVRNPKGVPTVVLHGDAQAAASSKGLKSVDVSISHDDFQAAAVASASA
ncbi:hypothetical protein CANCADRAFT_32052 [Tortispora caseinolytica NRRL Y-17796]|uniref:Fatty acid synthase subunit alpha n=1 Tax=Tortispora caseinolytica NRRL Y-17796 TaxID=767744 RepID=A0A1E4TI24_9ASCO|nr:hypothetical protein CANCADRAFT_32052 [Tortispora caseinolytica NRRL Y-17796]